jgi:hypothetical protein
MTTRAARLRAMVERHCKVHLHKPEVNGACQNCCQLQEFAEAVALLVEQETREWSESRTEWPIGDWLRANAERIHRETKGTSRVPGWLNLVLARLNEHRAELPDDYDVVECHVCGSPMSTPPATSPAGEERR